MAEQSTDGLSGVVEQERRLLGRCAAGDKAAFEPIVVAYRTRAYHYALSILQNHHDSLDTCQEAFVRAYRALRRFDLDRPFLPWFMRILRNLCLDEIARRRRRPESPGPEDPADILQFIHEPDDAPDSSLARADDASRIQRALSALPVEQREVVFLRHFEGMSYAGMAEVLGIPAGTVMSRLYHGRKNLAEKLKFS